ncbi:hypothetical protein ACFMQL_20600 [Nonomuraea fastidiosa]|uniref:hypothetical protein n=1 Tax=Nonomuraea fastidiosa TaxID=46173 RepID=UPI00366AFCED
MNVFPVADGGALVVPAVLPFRLTEADLKLTVADWLALNRKEEIVTVPEDDEPRPVAPWMDADVTEDDPDQSWLPQTPGSVVEDEDPEVDGGEVA